MTQQPCARAGCGGTITDGYCDTCGLAPAAQAAPAAPVVSARSTGPAPAAVSPSAPVAPSGVAPTSGQASTTGAAGTASARLSARAASSVSRGSQVAGGSRRTVRSDSARGPGRLGAGLVEIPPIPLTDPRRAVMADPQVAEEKRFCWKCAAAVGRTKGDRAGRTKGFCPNCGSAFDFDPRLGPGVRVGGQYEVVGCLAHGGFGWIYLAVDRNVSDRPVVLKGVLNQGDTEAVEAAIAEKRFLAELQHGNVVEIYNFVEHDGAGYIVMEFVGGRSLKQVLKDRMAANGGKADPLPVDMAIGYVLGILPALGYLHRQGYLYCDFKPDNVMHSGEDLKLIDLGGVRRIDDADGAIYGTVGFQAPEIATDGPSVSSDVYTVVRTLAVLTLDLPGYQREFRDTLPDPVTEPVFGRYESFYRLLLKGTALNPDDRFQSVDELADQLIAVLREVVAVSSGQPRPAVSNRFTTDRWRPASGAVLSPRDLPDLKPDDNDPAASFLTELVGVDAATAVREIDTEVAAGRVPDTPGVRLRRVQALVELDDAATARAMLADLRSADPWEWRVSWYEGLLLLGAGNGPAALAEFDRVRTDVPGELAPKLAAAMAAERSGEPAEASALYALVAAVDNGFVTALFGLARCRAALGDIDGAVAALHQVPASSAAQPAALEQEATWLLERAAQRGDLRDAASAAAVVQQAAVDGRRRAMLAATVLQQVLGGFAGGRLTPEPALDLFGEPGTEPGARRALERTLRELARSEPDRAVRIGLVDQANAVRPRTLW